MYTVAEKIAEHWFAPPARLAHAVESFWAFAGESGTVWSECTLPDAAADIVFALDAEPPLSATVRGPTRVARACRFDAAQRFVGARLRPGIAAHLLRLPAAELLDARVPARSFSRKLAADGGSPASALPSFVKRLGVALEERGLIEGTALSRSLSATSKQFDRVQQLARALEWSERTLERRLLDELGLSPKRYLRILRIRRALRALRTSNADSSAQLASELGFADQAHLCREFRELLGCTPTQALDQPINAPLGLALRPLPGSW
jgi:AraC-like DNA-binding protein